MSTLFGDLHLSGGSQESGMADNDVVAIRRQRLLECVTEKFGTQAKCVLDTGIHQGELSGLLRSKSFGEKKARSLEKKFDLPNKWLDGVDVDQDAVVADFAWVYAHANERGKALLRNTIDAAREAYCAIKDQRQA